MLINGNQFRSWKLESQSFKEISSDLDTESHREMVPIWIPESQCFKVSLQKSVLIWIPESQYFKGNQLRFGYRNPKVSTLKL
uniref:Uncharacterized protein n=1 Tax=Rhizophagus irregularis (strain DAOM 181602 / DAOM 197198 / MUCL 43194) TaxID=747089 RepID=U9U4R3_RHIID